MSARTRCNYCTMEDMKQFVGKTNREVTLIARALPDCPDGVDVYVHPPGEAPRDWWACWLASVPASCCCRE